MSEASSTNSHVALWEVVSMQVNAFPTELDAGFDQDWLEELLGESPESNRKKGHREDAVTIGGWDTRITVQPGRIVLAVSAPAFNPEEQSPLPDKMITLGPLLPVREKFKELFDRWVGKCPALWRIGFGTKIVIPEDDRTKAYTRLGEYLHSVKLDPINSSDFTYRINRRRKSETIPEVFINRLTTWAALKLDYTASISVAGSPMKSHTVKSLSACSVDIDINTAPECTGPYNADKLALLFPELLYLATEIAREGDIP